MNTDRDVLKVYINLTKDYRKAKKVLQEALKNEYAGDWKIKVEMAPRE